jgi:hypothetical protein
MLQLAGFKRVLIHLPAENKFSTVSENMLTWTKKFISAMNKTANCKVINTHWVYSHRCKASGKII